MTSSGAKSGIGTGRRISHPFLLVISGPSGVGKTSVVERVLAGDPAVRLSLSMTTRPPRAGEVPGQDYTFVSREDFARKIEERAFLEWAEVHGERYGTPRAPVDGFLREGFDVLLEIDVQGAMQVKRAVEDACLVFILPPSLDALGDRLRRRRRDSEEEVERRLAQAALEIAGAEHYDYFVVNSDLDATTAATLTILRAERHAARRVATLIPTLLGDQAGEAAGRRGGGRGKA
jgi:guanylate kinase